MICTRQHRVCGWQGDAERIERILAGRSAGAFERVPAGEYCLRAGESSAVAAAHPAWHCTAGGHVCLWAGSGGLVDDLIAGYRGGRSVNELCRSIPYSRATADRILKAHGVPRRSRSEQGTRIRLDEVQRMLEANVALTQIAAAQGVGVKWLRVRLARASGPDRDCRTTAAA